MSIAELVSATFERAYRDMDPVTGMFPEGWTCRGCGKELNADGMHPAELYAGTFTGLCYPCTNGKAHVVTVEEDGCQVWSYPPHCPSWRRDRETYRGYPDCETCKGTGVQKDLGWHGRHYCTPCHKRRFPPDPPVPPLPTSKARGEWEHEAYVEMMGHEPPSFSDPRAVGQWQYPGMAKTKKAREALMREVLA